MSPPRVRVLAKKVPELAKKRQLFDDAKAAWRGQIQSFWHAAELYKKAQERVKKTAAAAHADTSEWAKLSALGARLDACKANDFFGRQRLLLDHKMRKMLALRKDWQSDRDAFMAGPNYYKEPKKNESHHHQK